MLLRKGDSAGEGLMAMALSREIRGLDDLGAAGLEARNSCPSWEKRGRPVPKPDRWSVDLLRDAFRMGEARLGPSGDEDEDGGAKE